MLHSMPKPSAMMRMLSLRYRHLLSMSPSSKKTQGFTLVEMAVVVVLIGIVMTMGLKMVTATLDNAAYSETKSKQERIKIALIGYLRTNGKLPCPDNSAGVATGAAATPNCNADEASGYGVVPWQTLGIPRESAVDGWGDYFTYRVANGTSGSKNWTENSAPATDFSVNELTTPTDALSIQELNEAGEFSPIPPEKKKAVVVIISHGRNGFGAKTTKVPERIPITDAGTGEKRNADDTTSIFILRPVNDNATAFNGAYDDVVTYMSPQDLLQPLVSEGTLKACVSYCRASPSCTSAGTFSCAPSGDGYCVAAGAACTTGGTPACTSGTVQCVPPGTGCVPSSAPPIGVMPAICL